ncbi:MAG: MFS transporter [Erythrobacter sp.]
MIDAVMAPGAARASLAMSENPRLRLAAMFLLYVSQGLPLGLIEFALAAWLAQNGVSAAAIGGVLALVMLPWTFKLVYGFVMDRYAFLAMGRRRPWIILGQSGLVATLVAMAVVNPDPGQIGLIGAFAFMLGLWSAVQDVAVDGLAVDILPPEEIERVNGVLFGGQAIGLAVGTALGGYLIAWHGLAAAAQALAAMLLPILFLVLAVRERPGERLLPWTKGSALQRNLDLHIGAFGPIIRNLLAAMFTRQTLLLVPALIASNAVWGIFLGLGPLFSADVLGWEKAVYSGWSSQASLLAGIAGGLAFGLAAARWGARRMFGLGAVAYAACAVAMLLAQDQWNQPAIYIGAMFAFTALRVLSMVTFGSVAMRLCVPGIAATQFAVFMAIANLGKTASSASLGWLDSLGGYSAMFTAMALCGVIAALFAFIARVGR